MFLDKNSAQVRTKHARAGWRTAHASSRCASLTLRQLLPRLVRGLLGKKTCVVWETNEHEMQPCLRVGFSLCMSSHISIPNNQRTAQLSGQNTFCCGHTGPWGCTAGMARTCVSDNAVATASASTSEILALGAQWPNLQTRNVQPPQQREMESPAETIMDYPTMKIACYQRSLLDVACKMQEKQSWD